MEVTVQDLVKLPCRFENIQTLNAPLGYEPVNGQFVIKGNEIVPSNRFLFNCELSAFQVSILGSQVGLRGYSERVNLSLPIFNAMYLMHYQELGLPAPDFALINRMGDRINYDNWEERDCFTILNCSWYTLVGNDNRYFSQQRTPALNLSLSTLGIRLVDCKNIVLKLCNAGLGNYIFQICACFFSTYFAIRREGIVHSFPWSYTASSTCAHEFNQIIHTSGFYFPGSPNNVYKTQLGIPDLPDLSAFLSIVYQVFMSIGYTYSPNCSVLVPPQFILMKCPSMQVSEQLKDERGAILQFGSSSPFVLFSEVLDHCVSLLVGSCNFGCLLTWPSTFQFLNTDFDYVLGGTSGQKLREWFPRRVEPTTIVWMASIGYDGESVNSHLVDLGSFYYYRHDRDSSSGRNLLNLLLNNNQMRVILRDSKPATFHFDFGCKLIEDVRSRNFATYHHMLTHPLEWDGISALDTALALDGLSDPHVLEWIREVNLKIRGTDAEAYASGSNFAPSDQLRLRQSVLDHLRVVVPGPVSIRLDDYKVFFEDIGKYCLINEYSLIRCKGYPDLYDSFMLRLHPRGILDDTPRTNLPYGPFAQELLHFMIGCCDSTKTNFERLVNLWHYAWCDSFCMLLVIQLCSFGFLHLSSDALSEFGSAYDSYVHRFIQCPLTNYDLTGLMHLVGCLHILDGWGVHPGLSKEDKFNSEFNYFKSIVGLVGTDETINMKEHWKLSDMPIVDVEDLYFLEKRNGNLEKVSARGLTERVCERFDVPIRPLKVQDMGTPIQAPTQNQGVPKLFEDMLAYDIDRLGIWMQGYLQKHPPLVSVEELAHMYLEAPTGSVSHYGAANHPEFKDRMVRKITLELDEYRALVEAEQGGIIGHQQQF